MPRSSPPSTPIAVEKSAKAAKPAHAERPPRAPRGIQSVEVGGQLLQVLARTGRRMPLKDLASAAGMAAAKAHPYLVSLGKLGLVEQDSASGRYGLGPLALQLGLIGLQRADPLRMAIAELPALAQALGHTVAVSVWGDRGPTVVRVEEAPTAVYVAMRLGSTASVRHTATGKVFAAFSEPAAIAAALRAEGEGKALRQPSFLAELNAVREMRLSSAEGELVPGISALAVPVFDGFGSLVLCLSTIGPSATLDVSPRSAMARMLQAAAQALSERLGQAPLPPYLAQQADPSA